MSKFVWPAECFTIHSGSEKYSLAKPVCVGFETESYSVHGHVQVKWQFKIRWTCWCESGWTNVKGMLSLSRGFVVPWKTISFILLQILKWMKKRSAEYGCLKTDNLFPVLLHVLVFWFGYFGFVLKTWVGILTNYLPLVSKIGIADLKRHWALK